MDSKSLQDKPLWFDIESIDETMDAREMLKSGQHPLAEVMQRTSVMQTGKIFELVTPFTPMPLIEKVLANGYYAYVQEIGVAEVHTFFCKPG